MSDEKLPRWRVYLHSKPSPAYTFYQGAVTVFSIDAETAGIRARLDLKRGAFPDRGLADWVIEKVECLG